MMNLTSIEEFKQVLEENERFIVFFYQEWCPPCKMLKPILCEFMDENPDVLIYFIDNTNDSSIAKSVNVSSVPTLLLYKNKVLIEEYSGHISYEDLENAKQELFS